MSACLTQLRSNSGPIPSWRATRVTAPTRSPLSAIPREPCAPLARASRVDSGAETDCSILPWAPCPQRVGASINPRAGQGAHEDDLQAHKASRERHDQQEGVTRASRSASKASPERHATFIDRHKDSRSTSPMAAERLRRPARQPQRSNAYLERCTLGSTVPAAYASAAQPARDF
jgi:hypothetical protein